MQQKLYTNASLKTTCFDSAWKKKAFWVWNLSQEICHRVKLKTHTTSIHNVDKNQSMCSLCNANFKQKAGHKKHISRFHEGKMFSFKLYLQDFCFMFVEVTKVD